MMIKKKKRNRFIENVQTSTQLELISRIVNRLIINLHYQQKQVSYFKRLSHYYLFIFFYRVVTVNVLRCNIVLEFSIIRPNAELQIYVSDNGDLS